MARKRRKPASPSGARECPPRQPRHPSRSGDAPSLCQETFQQVLRGGNPHRESGAKGFLRMEAQRGEPPQRLLETVSLTGGTPATQLLHRNELFRFSRLHACCPLAQGISCGSAPYFSQRPQCFTTATASPRRRKTQDKGLSRMYAVQDRLRPKRTE